MLFTETSEEMQVHVQEVKTAKT